MQPFSPSFCPCHPLFLVPPCPNHQKTCDQLPPQVHLLVSLVNDNWLTFRAQPSAWTTLTTRTTTTRTRPKNSRRCWVDCRLGASSLHSDKTQVLKTILERCCWPLWKLLENFWKNCPAAQDTSGKVLLDIVKTQTNWSSDSIDDQDSSSCLPTRPSDLLYSNIDCHCICQEWERYPNHELSPVSEWLSQSQDSSHELAKRLDSIEKVIFSNKCLELWLMTLSAW